MSAFFDTNILVYAQQMDGKGDRARALLAGGGKLSVQVLNEFTAVSRRKQRRDWREIDEAVADVLTMVDPPLALTLELASFGAGARPGSSAVVLRRADRRRGDRGRLRHPVQRRHAARPQLRRPRDRQSVSGWCAIGCRDRGGTEGASSALRAAAGRASRRFEFKGCGGHAALCRSLQRPTASSSVAPPPHPPRYRPPRASS